MPARRPAEGLAGAMSDPSTSPDKDQVIKAFFQALKVTFKNSTMYNMDHPAFLNSVTDFQKKVEDVFRHVNPLSLGFTPRSVYLDGRFWEGEKIYRELGRLFHFRKVKSLEIRPGLTPEELFKFASQITLPLRTIFKQGGPGEILKRERIIHIGIEELDYSLLLKGEGEEIADVWTYLMEEALDDEDAVKLQEITESFEHVIGKFNTEDLIVNEELQKNFSRFFKYLKETAEDKYRRCAKLLVKSVVNSRKVSQEKKFENLKLLISGLREQDLADTLWEEVIGDVRFDALSFNVFANLVEQDRHQKISTSLLNLFRGDDPVNRKPEVESKIRALLSGRMSQLVPEVYRETLSKLLQEISFDQPLAFSHDQMKRSYWSVLLDVFDWETTMDGAREALTRLENEWEAISEARDFDFLRDLLDSLRKKKYILGADEPARLFVRRLEEFVEVSVLQGRTEPPLEDFLPRLKTTTLGISQYLERMFQEGTLTTLMFRFYFKFFKDSLYLLVREFEDRARQTDLLIQAVESLRTIDSQMSAVVLKEIYKLGPREIRPRILTAMTGFSESDVRFLLSVLRSRDPEIQGRALDLLSRKEETRLKAMQKLFDIESPYGLRNKTLLRNIRLVEAKDLRQAGEKLRELAGRTGLWNRRLRLEAKRVLEAWNA